MFICIENIRSYYFHHDFKYQQCTFDFLNWLLLEYVHAISTENMSQ